MSSPQPARRRLRYRYRLVAAMLLVSVPLMVVLAIFLTTSASRSLTSSAQGKGLDVARAVALRLEDWLSERRESLTVLGAATATTTSVEGTRSELSKVDSTYGDFSLIELTDLNGKLLASSRPGAGLDLASQTWFHTAAAGQPVLTSPVRLGDHIQWIIAQPVPGKDGHPESVLIGNLDATGLARPAQPRTGQRQRGDRR